MKMSNSRFPRISSLIPLNFFSISPRNSSIASTSFEAASFGLEDELDTGARDAIED